MTHLIEVAFRGNRKEFFQWEAETAPALHTGVIVEADRGEDFGRVHSTGELAELRCRGCAHGCGTTPPPRLILRLATAAEVAQDRELTAENESARRRAMERVKANQLVMKLTDAEWQFDRRKLTFYFTAERRVDFRALVRDLAAMFRARIELKQIGVRDEAKRLSGIGRCGREYCSASWLPDLRPVNLGVAKDQKLSLNPQQISGACGRLMCCLRYEHEFYVQSRRRFPKEGRILVTSRGEEKVITCDIFNDRVTLRSAEGDTRVVPLAELREDVGGFGEAASRDTAGLASADASSAADDIDVELMESLSSGTSTVESARPMRVSAKPLPEVAIPVATVPSIDTGAAARDGDADDHEDDGDASVVQSDVSEVRTEAAADATARGDEPRRKRRRGRRGGRRLRAAEQRRQEQDAANAADNPGNAAPGDSPDDDDPDDGDDDPSLPDSPSST